MFQIKVENHQTMTIYVALELVYKKKKMSNFSNFSNISNIDKITELERRESRLESGRLRQNRLD